MEILPAGPDVVALAHAEHILTVGGLQVDVTHGLSIRAGGDGVLFVVHKLISVNGGLRQVMQGVEEGVDGAVALAPGEKRFDGAFLFFFF